VYSGQGDLEKNLTFACLGLTRPNVRVQSALVFEINYRARRRALCGVLPVLQFLTSTLVLVISSLRANMFVFFGML